MLSDATSPFSMKFKKPIEQKLSLVALMDIFTILVFFLLMSYGEVQLIENAKFIHLPEVSGGEAPHQELIIFIDQEKVWLAQQEIIDVESVVELSGKVIPELEEALNLYLEEYLETADGPTEYEKRNGFPITLMADETLPYSLLKSVMATCRKVDFRNISLAADQIVGAPVVSEVVEIK